MHQTNPLTAAFKIIGFGIVVAILSLQVFGSFPGLLDKILAFIR